MNNLRKALRIQLKAKRRSTKSADAKLATEKIKNTLLTIPEFTKSKNIAVYLAFGGELDIKPIIEYAWANKKNCYLPILPVNEIRHLAFAKYKQNSPMYKDRYGILEPFFEPRDLILPQDLDVVLLPLVGFDENCNRLGQGMAYYDRTFGFKIGAKKHSKPILIGIGYEIQKIPVMETKPWDVTLDMVITDEKIYRPSLLSRD